MQLKLIYGLVVLALLSGCEQTPGSTTQKEVAMQSEVLTAASSESFVREWLAMIDALSPAGEYLKYLPNGDFEQWSYPDQEIRDVEELMVYFEKSVGVIVKNTNSIKSLNVRAAGAGRFEVVAEIDWTAIMPDEQTISRALKYTVTVGSGTSTGDPEGRFPKIYRYKIDRL